MKTIFTLTILAFSVCSFGQRQSSPLGISDTPESVKKDKAAMALMGSPNSVKKDDILTAADSIVLPIAKFEPSVKVDLDNFDAEITKLAKQYEDIIKAKNQTLKTAYGIYCGQKHIDPTRASVKLDKDGFIIQVLK